MFYIRTFFFRITGRKSTSTAGRAIQNDKRRIVENKKRYRNRVEESGGNFDSEERFTESRKNHAKATTRVREESFSYFKSISKDKNNVAIAIRQWMKTFS